MVLQGNGFSIPGHSVVILPSRDQVDKCGFNNGQASKGNTDYKGVSEFMKLSFLFLLKARFFSILW